MHDTTADSGGAGSPPGGGHSPFPDDALALVLTRLVRFGFLLERHDHGGVRVSTSEILALAELSARAPLSQVGLGELLGLEKSTVSRLVTAMVGQGWLSKERDPDNRRFALLRLTTAGQQVADVVGGHIREHHRALMAVLTPAEQQAVVAGLDALGRALERHAAGPHPANG